MLCKWLDIGGSTSTLTRAIAVWCRDLYRSAITVPHIHALGTTRLRLERVDFVGVSWDRR